MPAKSVLKKSVYMCATFRNMLQKCAPKKLISTYEVAFCFTLCLTLKGALRF